MKKTKFKFIIHDLNTWGGQDRSTLEILRRASHLITPEIYSYTLDDNQPNKWGGLIYHPIWPNLKRPAIIRSLLFYLITYLRLTFSSIFSGESRSILHSTGACSMKSDVIQVQFVQKAWQKHLRELKSFHYQTPATRSQLPLHGFIRRLYHSVLLRFNLWLEEKIYTREKIYIAISNSIASELQTFFNIPSDRIRIIHHGVDSELFTPPSTQTSIIRRNTLRSELGFKEEELILLFVGEYERKGLSTCIRSLEHLDPKVCSNLKLLAIGQGDQKGFYKLAQDHGVSNKLLLLTHQRKIEEYYQIADLFILPTFYEPFGLVILEAMAAGLPVIVSKIAGCAELIKHDTNGLLIDDPKDPKELARNIEKIAKSHELRVQIGQAARVTATHYSWDHVAHNYVALLNEIVLGRYDR